MKDYFIKMRKNTNGIALVTVVIVSIIVLLLLARNNRYISIF